MDTAIAAQTDLANLIQVQVELGLGLVSRFKSLTEDLTISLYFDPVYAVLLFHGMGYFTHLHH
jgi:hypothetical protein